MAGRILLRGAALGLAAATAGSLYALSRWTPLPSWHIPPFIPKVKKDLMQSALGLQASVLGVRPLSGAHLADVRALAEHDLARADAEDPAEATDLRLLLALLATRDSPFDPRPRALGFFLSRLAGRSKDEVDSWSAAYCRLAPGSTALPGLENHETRELVEELVIAATMGGLLYMADPGLGAVEMVMAWPAVDKRLAVTLQDEARSTAEKLQLQALRVFLLAKVRQRLKKEEKNMATAPSNDNPW